MADVAIHKVAYLGDGTGNGQFSALDAAFISRVVVALDSGFDAFDWTDPLIIGDTTGDGTLSGQDASFIAQKSVGLPRPEIPDDPDPLGSFTQSSGPDPVVSIASGVYYGSRGAWVTVPVEIDEAAGLLAADLQIGYDTSQLLMENANIVIQGGLNEFLSGWTLVSNTNESTGTIRIALYATEPHPGGNGALVEMTFEVESTAVVGTTVLDVEGQLNEGGLVITPVDGDFTVIGGDFDNDGEYGCVDMDALVTEIAAATHSPLYDLTGDGLVNLADRDAWLMSAAIVNGLPSPYLVGDANLDGFVDGEDFLIWNAHKFTSIAEWCAGDFNADGFVDGEDFLNWNAHKFQDSFNGNGNLQQPRQPPPAQSETRVVGTTVAFPQLDLQATADRLFARMGFPPSMPGSIRDSENHYQDINTTRPGHYQPHLLTPTAVFTAHSPAAKRRALAAAEIRDQAILECLGLYGSVTTKSV